MTSPLKEYAYALDRTIEFSESIKDADVYISIDARYEEFFSSNYSRLLIGSKIRSNVKMGTNLVTIARAVKDLTSYDKENMKKRWEDKRNRGRVLHI